MTSASDAGGDSTDMGISNRDTEHWGDSAGSNLYSASPDSADSSPKAEPPEQRGLTFIPLQAGYKSKKQCLTHIWLDATLLASSHSPQCYVTFFTFRFFKFYLSAMPSLSSCHFISTQDYLFLFWLSSLLHYSPLWWSDPPLVKEHHLDLGFCISRGSLHVQPFSFL
jgi:hypothetical protein